MIHPCITILSNLILSSKHAYLLIKVSEECPDVQYLHIEINKIKNVFILTKNTIQHISLNIILKNPYEVSYALVEIISWNQKEGYLIDKIQYQNIFPENCILFYSFNIAPRNGKSSLYFNNYNCITNLIIEQIDIIYKLNNGSMLIDSKNKLQMQELQCQSNDLNDRWVNNNSINFCCNSNFSCNQFQKTALTFDENYVDLQIKYNVGLISDAINSEEIYFLTAVYKKIYINGLSDVQVERQEYVINDYFFIARFKFSKQIGYLNNYNVTITLENTTLFLHFDFNQHYFILNCKKIYDVNTYSNCIKNLQLYKQKFLNNRNQNFYVNIFFLDNQNRLISRYSSSQKIDQILTQIISSYYYHNGVFYMQLIRNAGYEIKAQLIFEDRQVKNIILENYEFTKYKYQDSFENYQSIQMIIEIRHEESLKVEKYSVLYNLKKPKPYALYVYLPITVFMTLFSCLFLHPINYADMQLGF